MHLRFVLRAVPLILVEAVARLAGYIINLWRPEYRYAAQRRVRGLYWGARLGARRLNVGRNVQIEGDRISLGEGVTLYDGGQFISGREGSISIGAGSHVARLSVISGLGGVEIGKGCAISAHVAIYSVTNDVRSANIALADRVKQAVSIGDNVHVGMGAKIIPGVTIGDNAIIAAGAVVIRDVPANHLAKGVPARCEPITKRVAR